MIICFYQLNSRYILFSIKSVNLIKWWQTNFLEEKDSEETDHSTISYFSLASHERVKVTLCNSSSFKSNLRTSHSISSTTCKSPAGMDSGSRTNHSQEQWRSNTDHHNSNICCGTTINIYEFNSLWKWSSKYPQSIIKIAFNL